MPHGKADWHRFPPAPYQPESARGAAVHKRDPREGGTACSGLDGGGGNATVVHKALIHTLVQLSKTLGCDARPPNTQPHRGGVIREGELDRGRTSDDGEDNTTSIGLRGRGCRSSRAPP